MAYNFLLHVIFFSVVVITKSDAKPSAIFVFGDSTVDTGNNNYLPNNTPKANFPHYGIDFPDGVYTGRFCNGFLAIDYIAKSFGFDMSPPPFLSRPINDMQFKKGVNFASGGSGILDTTGEDVISFDEQIKNFKAIVSDLNIKKGKKNTAKFLANSFFYFSIGSNDLFALYNVITPNVTLRDQIVSTLANKFKEQLKEIYNLGARRFAVASTGLIGCIPALRVYSPTYDCNNNYNDISLHFKNATSDILKNLSMNLQGFKYSYADSYYFGEYVNKNPSVAGLKDVIDACCGSGKLNAEAYCSPNTPYCGNRQEYYFWDSVHPTEALYKFVAKLFLYGSKEFVTPINMHKLATY